MINQKKSIRKKKRILIKTWLLRSDLCNYSDAYIIVKGTFTIVRPNNTKRYKAKTFKNNAPFNNCISKINGAKIDNAEDLDVVMPMYNLFESSKNYKKTTGCLWNYCRDKPSYPLSSNSEPFEYKISIIGKHQKIMVH